MSKNIVCQFEFDNCCYHDKDHLYACRIQNQKFPTEITAANFIGKHEHGKSNKHVEELIISYSDFPNILRGMGKIFTNIKKLHIFSSNLETISKFDLQQFPNLEKLSLVNNPIEYLPGDLFEFTRKIEIVSASPNIKFIGEKLLDGLVLKRVDFCGNISINEFFNIKNEKTSLDAIKSEIKLKCKPPKEIIRNHVDIEDLKDLNIEENPEFISIKVGSKIFKIDRNLLTERSRSFAELVEKNPNLNFSIVDDIPCDTFEDILTYLNDDEPPIDAHKARELFEAAGKLKIESLKGICEEILINDMNFEIDLNFLLENFTLGVKYECKNLKLRAFEEIKKHFPDKKIKEEFMNHPDKMKKLISTKKSLDQQFKEFEDN